MCARGLDVLAVEPSAEMAKVLRAHTTATVVETSFETWPLDPAAFRCCYAAQSWHWVDAAERASRVAALLEPGGVLALFWNLAQPFDGPLGDEIAAAYDEVAPNVEPLAKQWPLDETLTELSACADLEAVEKRVFSRTLRYSTEDYVALMATHSSHRMLDDATRTRLQEAVAEVLERHGDGVDLACDTAAYLARRR